MTAKIRIYDDYEKSLKYAKMVLDAGAQFITVHGRTREMKGQATGLANWKILKYLRDNLPQDQVFSATAISCTHRIYNGANQKLHVMP